MGPLSLWPSELPNWKILKHPKFSISGEKKTSYIVITCFHIRPTLPGSTKTNPRLHFHSNLSVSKVSANQGPLLQHFGTHSLIPTLPPKQMGINLERQVSYSFRQTLPLKLATIALKIGHLAFQECIIKYTHKNAPRFLHVFLKKKNTTQHHPAPAQRGPLETWRRSGPWRFGRNPRVVGAPSWEERFKRSTESM